MHACTAHGRAYPTSPFHSQLTKHPGQKARPPSILIAAIVFLLGAMLLPKLTDICRVTANMPPATCQFSNLAVSSQVSTVVRNGGC